MQNIHLKIINEVGLHARPAALFVKTSAKYSSNIEVRNKNSQSQWVNAKSILGILTLGVEKDHEIEVKIEGEDEVEAGKDLAQLIENDFAA
jgi:phosphotransferase system HPr (HPr) family protein